MKLPLISKTEIMFLALLFLLALIYGAISELVWMKQLELSKDNDRGPLDVSGISRTANVVDIPAAGVILDA